MGVPTDGLQGFLGSLRFRLGFGRSGKELAETVGCFDGKTALSRGRRKGRWVGRIAGGGSGRSTRHRRKRPGRTEDRRGWSGSPYCTFPGRQARQELELATRMAFFPLFSFFFLSFFSLSPFFLCGLEYVLGGNESNGDSRSTKIQSLVSQKYDKKFIDKNKIEEINGV